MAETLEQIRTRIDQYGLPSEISDLTVAVNGFIDKNIVVLDLYLLILAEAAQRHKLVMTARAIMDAIKIGRLEADGP